MLGFPKRGGIMQTVLVVGLGEIGGTIFSVLKDSQKFKVYGFDLDKKKMEEWGIVELSQSESIVGGLEVLQICIPVPRKDKFIAIAKSYIEKYNPKLTIVNSTVPVGTTMELYKQCGGLIAHSPCRGVHKNKEYMKKEFSRWTKYVGGATPEAGIAAQEHFALAGLKTKLLSNCTDTEFAKLFETTYRTWMIVFFQKMHRLSRKYSAVNPDIKIDFDEAVDFIENTHLVRHDRPVMFPDVIGGHCLLPNSKLMLGELEPEMLKLILESNEMQIEEMKDPKIVAETQKVTKRVSKFEGEQDRQVMC
jgi:UDP-N-acetyl-D-mannosaminuronate dehydrogenase